MVGVFLCATLAVGCGEPADSLEPLPWGFVTLAPGQQLRVYFIRGPATPIRRVELRLGEQPELTLLETEPRGVQSAVAVGQCLLIRRPDGIRPSQVADGARRAGKRFDSANLDPLTRLKTRVEAGRTRCSRVHVEVIQRL